MNLRTIIILLAALGGSASLAAQDGSSGYNWLNITSSAKIYGLGGVNVSLVDDELGSSDQNPALLGGEVSGQIAVDYMRYLGGSNFAGARYAHSAGERGAWSASIRYFGYGSMKETLPDGSVVGTFSPKDVAFGGSYSHDFTDRLRGGISLKMLYSGYADYTAFALSTDIGLNYYVAENDMSLGLVLANLGGQIKRFDQAYDRLPFDVRLGWSQSFGTFPVRFSVTAWNLTKWHLPYVDHGDGSEGSQPEVKDSFGSNLMRHLVLGADLIASKNFYIGLGYNYKTRTDMATYSRSFISGWSLGTGLRGKAFGVHVAMAQPHTGGFTFMMNLQLNLQDLMH